MRTGAASLVRRHGNVLLATPLAATLGVLFVLPLALLLFSSVRVGDAVSLRAYTDFLSDGYNLQVIWSTLKLGLLTTLVCFAVGYPAAIALAHAGPAMQALVLAAMFLPLSVSVIVKAFGWAILLRESGPLNSFLLWSGLVDEPVRMIFTERALLIGMVNIFLPFMVMPIYSVLGQIDKRLFDAAATLGANRIQRFAHVLVPLTLPGVIAGVALVFSMSVSAYVIPSLLIGDRHQLLSTQIAKYFLFLRNEQMGSVAGVVLLGIAVSVVIASSWLARKARP